MHPTYTALWIAAAALIVVVEAAALSTKKSGRTLSSHVWRLRRWSLYLVLPLWTWMTYHFWIDRPPLGADTFALDWKDALAFFLGIPLAYWRVRKLEQWSNSKAGF